MNMFAIGNLSVTNKTGNTVKPVNTVTNGAQTFGRINGVAVLMGWPYKRGGRINGVAV